MKMRRNQQSQAGAPELPEKLREWLIPGREEPVEPEAAAQQSLRRQAVLPALGAAIRRAPLEARRERGRERIFWAAAAAAIMVFGGAGYALNHAAAPWAVLDAPANLRQVIGKVVLTLPSGKNRLVAPDTRVVSGEEISTTAQAFASVELGDQTRLDLSAATTIKFEKIERTYNALFLRSGRVDINVPKIAGEARQLRIRTPDVAIDVAGTIFSVEVTERDEQSVTTVKVSRGSLAVSHDGREHVLKSGEQWTSFPFATAAWRTDGQEPASTSEPSEPPRDVGQKAASSTGQTQPSQPGTVGLDGKLALRPPKVSSLARQNQLFELGLRARDSGDDAQAIRWFDRLTHEFPDSPLLPSANTERKLAERRLSEANP